MNFKELKQFFFFEKLKQNITLRILITDILIIIFLPNFVIFF